MDEERKQGVQPIGLMIYNAEVKNKSYDMLEWEIKVQGGVMKYSHWSLPEVIYSSPIATSCFILQQNNHKT